MCSSTFLCSITPTLIILLLVAYFGVLIGISWLTSRQANNDSFFLGNKKSPWYIVAFGMVGASLSGITFISIPGAVEGSQFGYMQMVFGYVFGYIVIAYVLMPIYYRLNVTSIYTYLEQRFGWWSYKTGAAFFLISRVIGASIRLLLVAYVLQYCVFDAWNVPFEVTVMLSILLIWLYTFRGGIKTIIWTDTLQTLFMLTSLGVTIYLVISNLELDTGVSEAVTASGMSQMFFFDDWAAGNHFVKQFLGGMFIAIGMTGLDQDMMQKNLSCKNLKDAQKNMMSFTTVLVVVNFLFLGLGALLYLYAGQTGLILPTEVGDVRSADLLFPKVALEGGLGMSAGILFLLGLIAAAYSSADSALTSLTTSVSVDFLNIEKKEAGQKERIRKRTHVIMSLVLFVVILVLDRTMSQNAIWALIYYAGFTYGPLIGIFFFGILSKRKLRDPLVPVVCLMAAGITVILQLPHGWFGDFSFGPSLIILNAVLTFIGLAVISYSPGGSSDKAM